MKQQIIGLLCQVVLLMLFVDDEYKSQQEYTISLQGDYELGDKTLNKLIAYEENNRLQEES